MQYRPLGNTDLNVSLICLGTMTWGEQNTETEAHAQLDCAMGAGVNFIDTAELYPIPPNALTQGLTETIIGNWFKARGNRSNLILATKAVGHSAWLPHIRDGKARLNRKHINAAVDASLARLQTDYIDLYQLHWPDRKTNFFGKLGYSYDQENNHAATEILETLESLADLITAGKIRHIGISNETPWGIAQYLHLATLHNLPRIVSIQNPYNLLNRSYEIGCAEFAERDRVGLLAYSPLGFGVLSGKYLNGARPAGARLTRFEDYKRYITYEAIGATQSYIELAHDAGLDPAQMALAYINSRPFTTSTIIGATTIAQLESNLDSIDVTLGEDVLSRIEAIHTRQPNPAP